MSKLLFVLSISVLFFSCNSKKDFDFGKTADGVYINQFFELEIPYNKNWYIQKQEDLESIVYIGDSLVIADAELIKSTTDVNLIHTAYLFTVFKYKFDADIEYNPSIMIIAQNLAESKDIQTGEDYLNLTKNYLDQSGLIYQYEPLSKKQLGNENFSMLKASTSYSETPIHQEYYSTIKYGFSLSIVLSYVDEKQKGELYNSIDQLKL